MGYPRRLLNEDEDVVFDLRPHWKAVAGATLLAPVIVGLASFAIARVPEGSAQAAARVALVTVAVGLFIAFCVVPWAKWLSTHFVVTTRRVIMRAGVLGRSGRDIPLFRINDVTFEHSFFERLLGAGSLIVESAGERGQVTLADIPHPEDVQREVYRLIELDDLRRRGESPPAPV
ncbi:MAG TPA: PH domain-containing protein [Mycobacteriales bacterium]|nr:PH domain-containing protein [Mycobacteriales bacterium]